MYFQNKLLLLNFGFVADEFSNSKPSEYTLILKYIHFNKRSEQGPVFQIPTYKSSHALVSYLRMHLILFLFKNNASILQWFKNPYILFCVFLA